MTHKEKEKRIKILDGQIVLSVVLMVILAASITIQVGFQINNPTANSIQIFFHLEEAIKFQNIDKFQTKKDEK
jgi:hypothetical protein